MFGFIFSLPDNKRPLYGVLFYYFKGKAGYSLRKHQPTYLNASRVYAMLLIVRCFENRGDACTSYNNS